MLIILDNEIPLPLDLFPSDINVELLPASKITPKAITHADGILIRSVTKVNEALLGEAQVKWVATATSGIDHLDTTWLDAHGIHWCAAPGCNAIAVAEYIACCVAALKQAGAFSSQRLRAGVIGVGHVGKRVVTMLKELGFEVVENDPPREHKEPDFQSTPLSNFHDLDLICLHTPLTTSGPYPTYHLIDKSFLENQKPSAVLLNAGRGEVINIQELKRYGQHLRWCFDVWENEPEIDLDILEKATIATPHIAGYSTNSKQRGANSIYQKTCEFFNWQAASPPQPNNIIHTPDDLLTVYNPINDTEKMKTLLLSNKNKVGKHFIKSRSQYFLRPEWHAM